MKIAFDENVPSQMVKVFRALRQEKRFRNITIEWAPDYTPKTTDPDYIKKNDVPWLTRFAKAGGKALISGDMTMYDTPHERLALQRLGLVTVFFERKWNEWDFYRKSALLLFWWQIVHTKMLKAKPGTMWVVPLNWATAGKLRPIDAEDDKITKPVSVMAGLPKRDIPPRRRPGNPKRSKTSDATLDMFAEHVSAKGENAGPEQAKHFTEAAREAECSEDEAEIRETMKRLAPVKSSKPRAAK